MSEIRLLTVLRSLDKYEFGKLGEIVESPFFNKNEKCRELYDLLKPFYPDFKDKRITREWLFEKLFPEKRKSISSLSTAMSKLQGLVDELIVYQEQNNRFLYKRHLLLNRHLKKGLFKLYQSQYKETMTRFSNIKKRDSMHFLEQYLLKTDYYKYNRTNKGRDKVFDPTTLSEDLDSYFWIQKLNIACEAQAYQAISSTEREKAYELIQLTIDGTHDHLTLNKDFKQNHLSVLFRKMLQSIHEPDNEDVFNDFFTFFLDTDTKAVDRNEYAECFVHSINYFLLKIKEGKGEYKKKLFDLYKLAVDFELIYDNGYLNLNRVKNIISCACQVGETDWADEFLEAYKGEIHPEQFNNAYHFYKAVICFYSIKYDNAVEFLSKIETDIDKYYFLSRMTFLLRCFYETKQSMAFENTCKTFRGNIKRNKKFTLVEQRSYDNFARIAYFLHQYRDGFSKKTTPKLLEMIEGVEYISHKQWLLEKWGELK